MTEHRRIVFVGPGVMAEAIVGGLIQRAGLQPSAIVVAGPRSERLEELSKRHGVGTESDSRRAMAGASTVVLSIKPQTLDEVMRQLHGAVPPEALVLSIVAGARLLDLTRGLAHSAVVRSMPNTPAQVGEGVTVWTATPETTAAQRDDAKSILTSCGQEIFVENEDYLDMATALSGTGPAYVFLFMEAMVDAGVHLARLRNQVTSPGGTSAAALYYLEKAGFRTALSRAIWAAYERSIQLGQGRKRGSIDEGA